MSEKIYQALTEDFIRRMRNWVRAKDAAVTQSSWPGMDSVYGRCDGSGWFEAPLPMLVGEAKDTELALRAIPIKYSQTVRQFWNYEGRPLRWHARHRGIGCHHTFEAWVLQGHEMLKAELAKASEVWRQHRQQAVAAGGFGGERA